MVSPLDPLAACPLKTVDYRVQSGSDTGVMDTFHLNHFYFTEIPAGHITVTISIQTGDTLCLFQALDPVI